MGTFTKKYVRAFHPEESLKLTWESGYRDVTIYDGDRIVKTWEYPAKFHNGITFNDEKLGPIKIGFTDTKPLMLELKVNGKKYKPTKGGKEEIDLSAVVSVFWALAVFTFVAFAFMLYWFRNVYEFPRVQLILGLTLGVTAIYFFTAFLMNRKYYGAFFLGYCYLGLSTLLLFFTVLLGSIEIITFIILIVRMIFLVYLSINIRKVLYAIKVKSTRDEPGEILDEV